VKDVNEALQRILNEKLSKVTANLQLGNVINGTAFGKIDESTAAPMKVSSKTSTVGGRKTHIMRIKTPSTLTNVTAEDSDDEYNKNICGWFKANNGGADEDDI
jgi:hypothetical protein